jgi:apolipoprotein N-acyltransferase
MLLNRFSAAIAPLSPSLTLNSLLALTAGLLFPLGFAPLGLWPLTIASTSLFVILLHGQSARSAFWLGWWYGFGSYSAGVSWVYVSIHFYGHTPIALAVMMTGIFAAGLALLPATMAWLYRRLSSGQLDWFLFPALWIVFDWIKTWLLSGFPWLFPGYALIDTPARHLAPLVGVFGMSWLAVATASLLAWGYWQRCHLLLLSSITILSWLGCYLLSDIRWTQPDPSRGIQVALVQGNISQERKWDPNERESIINTYLEVSEQLWGSDIVIWPEAAFPVFYQDALDLVQQLDQRGKASATTFISGAPFWEYGDGQFTYYNTVFANGNGSGFYYKQVLVPFGEFVPMESWIRGLLPFFDLPMSSFTPGTTDQQPLIAGKYRIAAFICYEIVYPELVRDLASSADVLLTISNDAWFGRSWGPHQHFEMARMRALELGKFLLRGTNTGITAIVNQHGNVVSVLPQFDIGVLRGTVYPVQGATPYSRGGIWPILMLNFAILLTAVYRRQRQTSTSPLDEPAL